MTGTLAALAIAACCIAAVLLMRAVLRLAGRALVAAARALDDMARLM